MKHDFVICDIFDASDADIHDVVNLLLCELL